MIWAVDADFHAATTMDIVMLGIFFSAVAICFLCFTTFHVLENHSPLVWETVSQLDHIGIVLGVFGSTIPLAHFGFYCNHRIKIAYWILVCMSYKSQPSSYMLTIATGHCRLDRLRSRNDDAYPP